MQSVDAEKPKSRSSVRRPRVPSPERERDGEGMGQGAQERVDGTRLVRAINTRAAELGYDVKQLAQALGMSYSYFITLVNEPHRFARINREYMRSIAKFLGINTILAYQYAGFLEEVDFDVDVTMDRLLDNVRDSIEADPVFAMFAPTKDVWQTLPKSVKLMTMSFYGEVQRLRHQVFEAEQERSS